MATSINLRLNDELERRLKEKVEEIKKNTPLGAEVNNSTVVRGALVDFFERIDKEKNGEKNISFYPNQLSNEELKNISNAFDEILSNIDNFIEEEKTGHYFVFDLLTMISNQLAFETIGRKNKRR